MTDTNTQRTVRVKLQFSPTLRDDIRLAFPSILDKFNGDKDKALKHLKSILTKERIENSDGTRTIKISFNAL